MENIQPVTSRAPEILTLILCLIGSFFLLKLSGLIPTSEGDNAPQVGRPAGLLGQYKAGFRWLSESNSLIAEGMALYGRPGKPFKIRSYFRWITFITSPEQLAEMKGLPLSVLSYRESSDDLLQTKYTLYDGLMKDAWHMKIIQRNLPDKLNEVMQEIFEETIAAWHGSTDIGDEWTKVNPYTTMVNVISRATGRALIGLPLCRNEEYMTAATNWATNVVETAGRLEMLPEFMRPFAAKWIFAKNELLEGVLKHIRPIFAERKRRQGTWAEGEKPNDVFQWIFETTPPGTDFLHMACTLIFFNLASIHTTSATLTQVIFDLCMHPHYQPLLRDEAEEVLKDGLSKSALPMLKKLDSVIRESLRMNPTNIVVTLRKVITSHTFSDGTRVEKGSWIAEPVVHAHSSEKCYDNPEVYNGFRFADMGGSRNQCAGTSSEFLAWGHGTSACPGRFFATAEMKIVLAYLLCNYEFRFRPGTVERPKNSMIGLFQVPDASVELECRKKKGREASAMFREGC